MLDDIQPNNLNKFVDFFVVRRYFKLMSLRLRLIQRRVKASKEIENFKWKILAAS